MGGPIPGATGDPLSEPAITENTWASIGAGHVLVHLGGDLVLDWRPATGGFRLFRFDRGVVAGADPLPGAPLTQGTWTTIGFDHRIVYLGQDRVLAWEQSTGRFRVWLLDRAATGNADPLPGVPQTDGIWSSIRTGHQLIPLGDGRVLDWVPATGAYRVFRHDPSAVGAADPLPGPPLTEGTWTGIRTNHELVPVGENRVLDWEPATGAYRVWRADPAAVGDPFPGDPEVVGAWVTIRLGHQLLYLGGDRVLEWEPNGHFRLWRYDRNVTTLRRATVRVHLRVLAQPKRTTVEKLIAGIVSIYGSYGMEVVIASRQSLIGDPNLGHFSSVEIAECRRSVGPTPDQVKLFTAVGGGVPSTDILVCVVGSLVEGKVGCATHPPDRPGAVIGANLAWHWTLAHEVGHVLGLADDRTDRTRLMYYTSESVIHEPPDLSGADLASMLASPLSQK